MPLPQQAATPAPTQTAPAVTSFPSNDPGAIYRALRDQRNVLGDQLSDLQNTRSQLQGDYNQMAANDPGRPGIEKRIQQIDARVADLDQQIAKSDAAVAQAAGVPGATVRIPDPPRNAPDPDMVAGLSFVVVLVFAIPISFAYARRIWRRSAKAEVTLPPRLAEQMDSLERGMEAVALEVERIGEGQRFLTHAMSERVEARAIGAGAAPRVEVRAGERVEQRR